MLIQKAYQFVVRPDGAQERAMQRAAGCRRWVMNKALETQIANRAAGGKFIRYEEMAKLLAIWRAVPEWSWLCEAPYHVLQQAMKDHDKAYKNFLEGRAAFPIFKKKSHGDSFRFPDPKQFKVEESNSRMFLPKIGWVRYHNSRKITGCLRNLTISSKHGHWYASVQTQRERSEPLPATTTATGIDLGVANFAAFSDGTFAYPLNSFKKHEQRLAKYQRQMSCKTKFSKNWRKAKAKVTKLHEVIVNARKDYLHQLTTRVSKSHALVAIEDLKVGNMSQSAKGTVDYPGKNVKAKSSLNKAILDQGWFEFRRQLDYKLLWKGAWLIAVPPQYTSQTCPCCGNVDKANRQSQSLFLCTTCWYDNHADTVGAINVLDRALAKLASEYSNEGQDTARLACQVNGAVMPSAAGTHRSDLLDVQQAQ